MPKNKISQPNKSMEFKLTLLTRFLLRLVPKWGLDRLTVAMGLPAAGSLKHLHQIFASADRVDILPAKSGFRGFQLVLDNLFSLYFCQDGDHFIYDGFEMGEYEKGNVTVFDRNRWKR